MTTLVIISRGIDFNLVLNEEEDKNYKASNLGSFIVGCTKDYENNVVLDFSTALFRLENISEIFVKAE